ncbi:MAG: TlpA family protein disulfide reductase [Clostridiales bacterium]|nr:TlpA family protein disulfide reductase [Clostridiales bacterium]
MKKRLLFILLTAVFMMVSGCGNKVDKNNSDTFQELSEEDLAPDFTAETVDGKTFALAEQKGKVVLLNFWATWCGPCVGEMPAFEKLYSEYGEKIEILAVDCSEDENTVKQFVSDNGYTFPIAYDIDGSISMKYPTQGIPYTLVIGKDGKVKKTFLGADDADAQYQEYKKAIDEVVNE